MRPSSQRNSTPDAQKPFFQTKLKGRPGATGDLQKLNASVDTSRMSKTERHFHHFADPCKQDLFAQTASKLTDTNFAHHCVDKCVCSDCHCGRHLCSFKVVKPDLTKNSIYQRSFYQQAAIPNIVNHDKEYEKLKGPHLDMRSTYVDGFKGSKGDHPDRPHPEDLLHSSGPCPALSSYSAAFANHKGNNQYVKPTDKHTRGQFPLRSRSTYAKEFAGKQGKGDDYTYYPDQLKTGYDWLGKTTYGDKFSNPNPEYFAKKVKVIEKKEDNPNYSLQYRTIYKNDFLPKQNAMCPSKVHLQTKAQGNFSNSKHSFAQNADFKALSPDFHAISTSKHSFV